MDACISIVGSILGSLAGKAAEYTVDPIAQQLGYLFNHKTKFQNLQSKVQYLKDARERIQQSVDEANRNGEEIFDDVDRWLTLVNNKISGQLADTQLQEDEEKATKRCFVGLCPDFKSRYQLSKKAEMEATAIAQLLDQKDGFTRVSHPPALEVRDIIRPVKEFEAFGSRSEALNEVMSALENDNVNVIGVHGTGGVGKTTLVKEVAGQAREKLLFDEVIFVAVTQTPNTQSIQSEIANKLGLDLNNDPSVDVRAARLRDRLKKVKKVLIILDDIWEEQNVDTLGIPSTDQHKGCNILMTSRKLVVLKKMGSQKCLPIDILKEDEAWNLFKNVAGHVVERPDLQLVAKKVAQKCAGLPIAIVTVAKALKHKENLYEWEDALEQLKPSQVNFRGISGDVYSAIELSYKYLEVEEVQSTFLLCCTMRHTAFVEDLVKHCRGLGLFRGLDSIGKVRNRVKTLVSELKDSSLLLAGPTPEHFDIHDVVRDVAISIASRDHGWLVLGKEDIFEVWSDEDKMKNSNLVSLQYAKVTELPDELECPNLTFFSMRCSEDSSVVVPNNFLRGMQRLKVLCFAKPHFTSLPSSIGSLKTLSTLCLSSSQLKDVRILGGLENLEILDLSYSNIAELPNEIGQLTKLKFLDLSDCFHLKVISPNVLPRLSRLEELYLYGRYCGFGGWEVEGGNERRNASVDELQHLSRLTTLEIHIPDVHHIPKDNLFFGRLERYKISIGRNRWIWTEGTRNKISRMLKLSMEKKSIHLVHGVKTLLRKVESLDVDGVEDVGDMLCDPITEGFPHLKHLRVCNVRDIKVVINSTMKVSRLESLTLSNLSNLEAVCDHAAQINAAEWFGRLKLIRVFECNLLKNLLSFSVAKEVCRQLEEILVHNCENMRELILVEKDEFGTENHILEFTQLHSLKLEDLPRFNRLWYCSEITPQSAEWLFDQQVSLPAMKKLELNSVSGIEKSWHDNQLPPVISSCVGSLTSLKVESCHKLKYAFTSSMVKCFVHLKILEVSKCHEMQDIIEVIRGEEEINSSSSSNISVFPKLDSLELDDLPKLKRFCSGVNITIKSPSLRELQIGDCPVLSAFLHSDDSSLVGKNDISLDHNTYTNNAVPDQPQHLFNQKVILPMLEKLVVYGIDNLEGLWSKHLAECSFSKLTSIHLENCPKLLNVFPSSMLTRLQGLKELYMQNCESVEEIIFESESQLQEEGRNSSAMQSQFIQSNVIITSEFPCLTYLGLVDLPNLKSMHHEKHIANWPSLEQIQVDGCEKVEILFGCEETLLSGKSPIQQPLFWVNRFTFPNLHKLTLGWKAGMKEIIWPFKDQQFVSHYFHSLKEVLLVDYPEEVTTLPSYLFHFLSSLPTLQTLEISHCYFKEMTFQSDEGGEEKPACLLPSQISELSLQGLPQLLHLSKENEGFQNLVTLKVWRCDGMIKLITHSTAKTLVRLRQMEIKNCANIEVIIEGGDDEEEEEEICFPKLNTLTLKDLPKLESFFSSGNYTFGFPSLQTLVVNQCPKMKMFSQRDSNTPILHKVILRKQGDEERWEGSFNSTIQ